MNTIVNYLNVILSDMFVMSVKAHNFHWNVLGPYFGPLHSLFGELYDLLSSDTDTIAERIRALKEKPVASLSEFLRETTIKEVSVEVKLEDQEMLQIILDDLQVLIGKIKNVANASAKDNLDMATNNMLLNMLEVYEKKAWMVRSHLQAK